MTTEIKFAYGKFGPLLFVDQDPIRACTRCGHRTLMSQMYALTPLNINPFDHMEELKRIGLLRCKQCIPPDAVAVDEYLAKRGPSH